jgi:GTP-binding protein HflX
MNIVESNTIQKTILVYLEVDSLYESQKLENGYEEFKSLALSSGLLIKNTLKFSQKSPVINTFISKGKLEKLKDLVFESDVDLIIINHQLSASQTRNLEKYLDKRVIDKTELILDIFATRATSHIGKLQVELAQLNHLSTRLIRGWTHLERQKGGIGLRGPGETQLETDRRLIGKRIKRLNLRLEKSHKQREINRYSRKKSRNKLVALVGYTNAGKTTLFNKLTKSSQIAEDKLFATLDSVTRKNTNPDHGPILFSDTVGFISDLPTQLIESFKATLDELKSADMLLHIVDISDVDHKTKIIEVNNILEELGVSNISQIIVNNKCDLIEDSKIKSLKKRKQDQVFLSAENENDLRA